MRASKLIASSSLRRAVSNRSLAHLCVNHHKPTQRHLSGFIAEAHHDHSWHLQSKHSRKSRAQINIGRQWIQQRHLTTLQSSSGQSQETEALSKEETPRLYTRLRALAISEDAFAQCKDLATYLVKVRRQLPNLQLYNALILSNVCHKYGSAWRVHDLLQELFSEGLQPDISTCHAVLEVLSVHPDHLLRADILEYMRSRWFQVSNDGMHLVAAGFFREGLHEQALATLSDMRQQNIKTEDWLWDIAIHHLCGAGEIEEAYRIMLHRQQGSATNISRVTWFTFLDSASSARHYNGTRLAWKYRVQAGYLNPPAGICMNVLITTASVGDEGLATEVFAHITNHNMVLEPIHYDLLMASYLFGRRADIIRAISLLPIMASENIDPSSTATRNLFAWLREHPGSVDDALARLRELHATGQKIPIAALNLLIECCVEQNNLEKAMRLYKTIHTFVQIEEGAKATFANIDTINLLLKGCRKATPPNENLASFLISEMLALRIRPTPLTYDRLVLVFVRAAAHCQNNEGEASRSRELLGWAYRHFHEMQSSGWLPRKGTISQLAIALAGQGDARCWDVLQTAEDNADRIENWDVNGSWVRNRVESLWPTNDRD